MTSGGARKHMVHVPAGRFLMGSDDFYPEERPVREVTVGDLWVDEHPVTNAEFRRFVKDTGHVTVAERAPDPADFPGADPRVLVPGSQVFTPTRGPVSLDDWTGWWAWVSGADWRHPLGPLSTLHGRELPVGRFPPNGYGLYDVTGNVWEWTRTPWTAEHAETGPPVPACCGPAHEHVGERHRRVMKGGSHICAPSYCHRYRPAARQGHAVRSTASHLGFRCVLRS